MSSVGQGGCKKIKTWGWDATSFLAATASTAFLTPDGNPDEHISFVTVFVQPIGWIVSLQLIPIALGISILRHRLFDVDIIIRRTLIYSIITAMLAPFYFGSVVGICNKSFDPSSVQTPI